MNTPHTISDEQLNALVDNELENEEKNLLLETISHDPELQNRYDAIRKTKDMLIQAYAEVPQPISAPASTKVSLVSPLSAVAALVFLLIGTYMGVLLEPLFFHEDNSHIKSVAELNVEKPHSNTILLHISTTDKSRVHTLLKKAESLLTVAQKKNQPLRLEIVANAEGLNILRKGSPHTEKISALSKQYTNIQFLACGIAKKAASLRERKPIELLPEVSDVPAALDQILTRLKDGWTYVRG